MTAIKACSREAHHRFGHYKAQLRIAALNHQGFAVGHWLPDEECVHQFCPSASRLASSKDYVHPVDGAIIYEGNSSFGFRQHFAI